MLAFGLFAHQGMAAFPLHDTLILQLMHFLKLNILLEAFGYVKDRDGGMKMYHLILWLLSWSLNCEYLDNVQIIMGPYEC